MPNGLDGVLFFPVTPFASRGAVDLDVLGAHIRSGLAHGPGGVFVACGTGEFHALAPDEYADVVATAVKTVNGAVPVYAGAGGPLPTAVRLASAAAEARADGLLLMPPYLVDAPAAGLLAYVSAVAGATDLPVIVYQRGTMRFDPATAASVATLPTVAGFKDGTGDIDQFARIVLAARAAASSAVPGKELRFFNGLPTAEITAAAYRGIGVPLYSSAAFAFVPEVAIAFHRALVNGDVDAQQRLLSAFFYPFTQLRSTVPGYAVALVKAGVRLRGLDAGGVRPPLIDPSPSDIDALRAIIDAGLVVAAELKATGPEATEPEATQAETVTA
jgi:5-dehydro-4-deoxyglucarate dehydratase